MSRSGAPFSVRSAAMAIPFEGLGRAGHGADAGVAERGQRSGLRGRRRATVEGGEGVHVHALDVAADAALAEGEGHPRLEALERGGPHLRMGVQEVVEPVGPGVHEGLQEVRALRVERLHLLGVDEELHAQVPEDRGLALGLGEPALGEEEVALDAGEVVLGLGVEQAEDRVGVRRRRHVRDAPVVPDDGHAARPRLPALDLRRIRGRGGGGGRGRGSGVRLGAAGGEEEDEEREQEPARRARHRRVGHGDLGRPWDRSDGTCPGGTGQDREEGGRADPRRAGAPRVGRVLRRPIR